METTNHQPQETEHHHETEPKMKPKIYAACLAAYNHGHLHGEWIHADQEADYLMAEVQDMLEKSPIANAEEFAIHDYEDFGAFSLHEYERLETIARVAGGLAMHGPAFAHWIHEVGSDAEDAIETFEDHYRGTWESMADYAEHLTSELGAHPIREDWLEPYVKVDFEMLGRDLAIEMVTAEDRDGVHVFDPQ